MTKDERFLLELYKAALQAGDPKQTVNFDVFVKRLGYKELLVKDVLKGLRKANLVHLDAPGEIGLTPRGEEVARSLHASS